MAAEHPAERRPRASGRLALPNIQNAMARPDLQFPPIHIQFLFVIPAVEEADSRIATLERLDKDLEVVVDARPPALASKRILVDGDHGLVREDLPRAFRHVAEIVAGHKRRG